jgi:hypothetical protein
MRRIKEPLMLNYKNTKYYMSFRMLGPVRYGLVRVKITLLNIYVTFSSWGRIKASERVS